MRENEKNDDLSLKETGTLKMKFSNRICKISNSISNWKLLFLLTKRTRLLFRQLNEQNMIT